MADEKTPTESETFFSNLKKELTGDATPATPAPAPTPAPAASGEPTLGDVSKQLATVVAALSPDGVIAKGIGSVEGLTKTVEAVQTALEAGLDRIAKLETGTAMKKSADGDDNDKMLTEEQRVAKNGVSSLGAAMNTLRRNPGKRLILTG
jgi:hypothetical protein